MTLMHFIDRLFLSWSSPEEIAASFPAGILAFTIGAFFLGVSEYTNTFVAQFHGANRNREIALSTWQGIFFSVLFGIAILGFIPIGNWIFDWAGHAPLVVKYEKTYFFYMMFSMLFLMLNGALSSFYSGRGKTKVIMSVSIAGNTLNAVLDYALIFGAWGFPEWGIKGAAVATLIATAFTSVLYFLMFLSPDNHRQFETRKTAYLHYAMLKRLLYFGTPSGMVFFIDVAGYTAFLFLIGQLGIVELAATNIVITLNMLAFFPMIGASIATSSLVGKYIGSQNHPTAQKSAYSSLISVEIYMAVWAIIYILFPTQLMAFFQTAETNPDVSFQQIADYGATILLWVAIYQIFDAMFLTFSGALRGAGDTHFAMWASALCSWCFFVPGTWIALKILDYGVIAAWIWATIYVSLVGLLYLVRFQSGHWKHIEVIPEDPMPHPHHLDA